MAVSQEDRTASAHGTCFSKPPFAREVKISGALTEENLFDGWNAHTEHPAWPEDPLTLIKEPQRFGGANVFDDVFSEDAVDNVIVVREPSANINLTIVIDPSFKWISPGAELNFQKVPIHSPPGDRM